MLKNVEKFGTSDKRGREKTNLDPISSDKGLKDPSLCKHCHNYFHLNRWSNDIQVYEQLKKRADVNWVVCPPCRKVQEGFVEGVLTLSGSYFWKHEAEIRRLLQNEEDKIFARNPLEKFHVWNMKMTNWSSRRRKKGWQNSLAELYTELTKESLISSGPVARRSVESVGSACSDVLIPSVVVSRDNFCWYSFG